MPAQPDEDHRPPQQRISVLWLLFVLPGTIILWWQYRLPKRGQVWATARRRDDPFMRVLYSLGFWVAVMFFTLILIDVQTQLYVALTHMSEPFNSRMVGLYWFVEDDGTVSLLALALPLDQAGRY